MVALSLPADVLWGLFVTHSFLPHGERNEYVTNKPHRTMTKATRLMSSLFRAPLYTAISGKVVGKSVRDNPERYCGWF